jgi:CheY-like chemotaxis protein
VVATSPGVGRGSEFIVRLPLANRSRTTPTSGTTDEHVPALKSLRVLVVDDNHDAADSLGTMLTFLGAEARVTYSGAAALDAIAEFQPSVALLDIGMPGMDGYTIARRVRELREHRDMTLIALSGWATEDDKRRSLEAGFNYHLIKPPDVEALKALIISLGSRPQKQHAARSHK